MDKFELQKLRDLPIEGVAERLGLEVVRHKCLCPFHDDHHASLSFSVRRNTYRCFACGAHGGVIDLAMGILNKPFLDATKWLANEPTTYVASGCSAPALPSFTGGVGGGSFDANRYARFFERPWLSPEARRFLYDERRIDPRVVRWCRLTSWKDKQGVNWLQIPYYDRDGRLVGIQNRNLTPSNLHPAGGLPSFTGGVGGGSSQPRFRFPQGSECSIYNLPVLNMLRPGEPLYITEGCSDCWAMLSAGHKAIAIPSATLLKPKDMELLNSLNTSPLGEAGKGLSFHMYPDRDEPGERLFMQLQQVLPNLEHHQLPLGCKDFSDYYVAMKRKDT